MAPKIALVVSIVLASIFVLLRREKKAKKKTILVSLVGSSTMNAIHKEQGAKIQETLAKNGIIAKILDVAKDGAKLSDLRGLVLESGESSPDFAYCMVGVNDIVAGTNPDLKSVASYFSPKTMVFLTVQPLGLWNKTNSEINKRVRNLNAIITSRYKNIDLDPLLRDGKTDNMKRSASSTDGLHPNATSRMKIAEMIAADILKRSKI